MKLKINKKTNIYIIIPANLRPGGPKDLHYLAYIIKKKLKKKVFIYYYSIQGHKQKKNPIHPDYKAFKIPYVKNIVDKKENILIIPEMNYTIDISKQFDNIQKVLWWMSFDNYLYSRFQEKNHKILKSLLKAPFKIIDFFNKSTNFILGNINFFQYLKFIYLKMFFYNVLKVDNIKLNLSQCEYITTTLKSKKIKSEYFSGYLKDDFIKNEKKTLIKKKKNIVCYNKRKSLPFMDLIIKKNPSIRFIPLEGFSTKEVIEILKLSKLYIDFGYHPGQDHLPREAVILKNCIITNKKGSAAYFKDMPIPDEFKFDESYSNLLKITKQIKLVFSDYDIQLKKFKFFRNSVRFQENKFKKQVYKIFQ
jgi:hypothetical protein